MELPAAVLSGCADRQAERVKREDELIESYVFFSECMTEKNAEKEAHKAADKACGCQDQCASYKFAFC